MKPSHHVKRFFKLLPTRIRVYHNNSSGELQRVERQCSICHEMVSTIHSGMRRGLHDVVTIVTFLLSGDTARQLWLKGLRIVLFFDDALLPRKGFWVARSRERQLHLVEVC